jgi:hypothetical protein
VTLTIQQVITERIWVKPGDYPIAITEIIEANAPDRRFTCFHLSIKVI